MVVCSPLTLKRFIHPTPAVRAMLTDAPADAEAIWQKQEDAHAYDLLPQKEKVHNMW